MQLYEHVPARPPQSRRARTPVASAYEPSLWTESAACRGADPELFFPGGHSAAEIEREAAAKALCQGCPVITACLRDAMRFRENVGIWGGFSVRERRELRRVAQAISQLSPTVLTRLENGAEIRPRPYERIALAWALHRRGWQRGNIGGVLGLSAHHVDQALQTARWASVCQAEASAPAPGVEGRAS